MDKKDLTKILNDHKKWVNGEGGERANLCDANLCDANLRNADLWNADLRNTNLWNADLRNTNLRNTNLCDANLCDANLRNANLRNANLRNTNLCDANLCDANLRNANLRNADLRNTNLWNADLRNTNLCDAVLPPPTILLLCNWGKVSDKLTSELMRYDATNHHHPHKFQEWADGGDCPYSSGFPRVAHFQENKELWKPGKAKSARELVLMLFKEKGIKYDPNL